MGENGHNVGLYVLFAVLVLATAFVIYLAGRVALADYRTKHTVATRELIELEKAQDEKQERESARPSPKSYDINHLPRGATSKDRTESDKWEAEDNDDN